MNAKLKERERKFSKQFNSKDGTFMAPDLIVWCFFIAYNESVKRRDNMFGNNYTNPYGYGSAPFGYNPNATYPNYMAPTQNTPIPSTNTNKIFVNGIEDVRNRPLSANSDYMFLDNDKPLLYQKVVDNKGQFEVKVFDITPHKEDAPIQTEYVLKSDFDKLYVEFIQVKNQLSKLGGLNESIEKQHSTQQSSECNVAVSE